MRSILILLLSIFFISSQITADSTLTLAELWDIPIDKVEYKIAKSYQKGSIKVEEIYYQSRSFKGKPVRIFGYFCYPAKANKKLPAIIISHGGGGLANLGRTIGWAKHGYAVLSIDLPGQGEQRARSRSTGPDMDVYVLLRTKPDPTYNYLIHSVAAVRNGITFLTQRNMVDAERIGMVGLSWGGVNAIFTNGQDKRLKTAVNVFGAGYIPEGCTWQERFNVMSAKELGDWNQYIDPKNFLKTQHAPILFITGTNDHCYYLNTFQKSYAEVNSPKKLILIPNLRHKFLGYMQSIVIRWLDNKLKYDGSFPEVEMLSMFRKGKDKIIVPVKASGITKLKTATLYYANGGPSGWTNKKWKAIKGYFENGIYYFGIPTALISPEIVYYVTVKDIRGGAASTLVRSLFEVEMYKKRKTYALSSPIKQINIHESPLSILGFEKMPEFSRLHFSKPEQTYRIISTKPEQAKNL